MGDNECAVCSRERCYFKDMTPAQAQEKLAYLRSAGKSLVTPLEQTPCAMKFAYVTISQDSQEILAGKSVRACMDLQTGDAPCPDQLAA
jgi:hypothetical protein